MLNVFFKKSKCVLLMINIIILGRSIEMDHMQPSLVHDFFHVQSIRMIPFHKFEEVVPNVQYKKCKNKFKKTWYSLTQEAFFEYMYKVNFLNLLLDELHSLKQLHLILNQRFSCKRNLWLLLTSHIVCIMEMFQIPLFETQKCWLR